MQRLPPGGRRKGKVVSFRRLLLVLLISMLSWIVAWLVLRAER
ncbi:hypothetical protein [Sphingomonas solaris]|nr:hypothetical protein [Sphingomonas solaris]